jgi:hypothetical protein
VPHRATSCRRKIRFINKHWAFFVLSPGNQELTEGSPAGLRVLVIKDSRTLNSFSNCSAKVRILLINRSARLFPGAIFHKLIAIFLRMLQRNGHDESEIL